MIKFYIKNTHGKFFFDECTKEEKDSLKKLLIEKFTVKDSSLERDYRVIRGQMSPYKCFYNEEYDIIQSGLWPYISVYAKKENIQLSRRAKYNGLIFLQFQVSGERQNYFSADLTS